MSHYERTARVDSIDESTGVFQMTLATEGEASDGHILSIKGGQIPERMPLLVSHYNEPTTQAGSITEPKKALKDAPPALRATGRIEMSGEGPSAEIRRDLAHMIARGHVSGMSVRWDEVPGKTIRRVNLPSKHPYFVDSETESGPARWGSFFDEWRAMEGSIVSLGADPGALIGRAEETEGAVSQFWRAMASDLEGTDIPSSDEVIADTVPIDLELDVAPYEEPSEESKQAAALAQLREASELARGLGINDHEIAENCGVYDDFAHAAAIADDFTPEPDQEPETEVRVDQPIPMTLDLADIRKPLDINVLTDIMSASVDKFEERIERKLHEILKAALGRV